MFVISRRDTRNKHLAWLTTGKELCRMIAIPLSGVCLISLVEEIIPYYFVKDHISKSELIARILIKPGGMYMTSVNEMKWDFCLRMERKEEEATWKEDISRYDRRF